MASIETNIKKLRKKNKMSQEELADRLNCTRQTISNYERGVSQPDIDSIKRIAEIFNCDIKEVINGENKKDKQAIIKSIIRTFIIVVICVVLYRISIKMLPQYFNNALLLVRLVVIPFTMYSVGVFMGDVLNFYDVEIKNENFKKIIRLIFISFLVLDIVLLIPVLFYNIYILIIKIISTENFSFSFISDSFYTRILFHLVKLNIQYSWIFIFIGIGMKMSIIKKVTFNENIDQKVDDNIL